MFKCPRCGSSHFGSHQLPDGTLERGCHGYIPDPEHPEKGPIACTFTWHQRDDAKYGLEPLGGRVLGKVRA